MSTCGGSTVTDATVLNTIMDIDAVVEILPGRRVKYRSDILAPCVYDEQLDNDRWTLMNGYSGQDSYSGPIMHNSEFIGGRMAEDILNEPGVYVALAAYWTWGDDEDLVEGWAVAHMKEQS